MGAWTSLIWLWIGTGGRRLWTQWWTLKFHITWRISLTEEQWASQKGFFSVWLVGWLVGQSVIRLVTQEKGTQNLRIKENKRLHVIVEHVWDSPGVSTFCPVRKLKVYGHFILLIRSLLLLLLLLMCTCTCWRTSVILLENFCDPEYYWEWFSQKCDLPARWCTAHFVHMHKIFSTTNYQQMGEAGWLLWIPFSPDHTLINFFSWNFQPPLPASSLQLALGIRIKCL